MRLSVFLEAWVQLVFRREPDRAHGVRDRIPREGVTELIKHHKVAAAPSQPWRGGPIEAAGGLETAKPLSGAGRGALLAHGGINIWQEIPI